MKSYVDNFTLAWQFQNPMVDIKHLLTAVVIGRNEGERLLSCIKSIQNMQKPEGWEIEIIYVDSSSTDNSINLATSLGVNVLSTGSKQPNAAIARNVGWKAAKGEIILFLDGDTILNPQFVITALKEFKNDKIAIIWGHRREINPSASYYHLVVDLEWIYPLGYTEYCGGDALMQRQVLSQVNGFDESFSAGEEPEMCRRIRDQGYLILHLDIPMTLHDIAMRRFSQYWNRAVRSGYAYEEVSNRTANSKDPLWQKTAKNYKIKGALIIAGLIITIFLAFFLHSFYPLVIALTLIILYIIKSAFKIHQKATNWRDSFIYGFHSLFVHIPIFIGQLKYRINLKSAPVAIQYKDK